jgi:hypothetical protein
MKAGRLAGPSFADIVDLLETAHNVTSDGRPHHFFSQDILQQCFVQREIRQHTPQLNVLVFNCFKRRISVTPMPA